MRHALAQCAIKLATGKPGGPHCPFLAAEFLAVHQVHHGHQKPGNGGVNSGIRSLKHHRNQVVNQAAVILGGGGRRHFPGSHTTPQFRQPLQAMKRSGQLVQQPAAHRVGCQFPMDLRQGLVELPTQPIRRRDHGLSLAGKFPAGRAQKHIGRTPFALQRMHQVADALDQFAHLQKILEVH